MSVCVCVCVLHGTMCPMMSIFLAYHPPTKVPRDTHESRQPAATQKTNTTTARKDMYPHTCTYHGRHLRPPCEDPSLPSPGGRLHLLVFLYPVLPPLYSFLYFCPYVIAHSFLLCILLGIIACVLACKPPDLPFLLFLLPILLLPLL